MRAYKDANFRSRDNDEVIGWVGQDEAAPEAAVKLCACLQRNELFDVFAQAESFMEKRRSGCNDKMSVAKQPFRAPILSYSVMRS